MALPEIKYLPVGTEVYAVRESSKSISPGRVVGHSIHNNQLFHGIAYHMPDGTTFGGGDWSASDLETDPEAAKKRIMG